MRNDTIAIKDAKQQKHRRKYAGVVVVSPFRIDRAGYIRGTR